MSHLFPTFYRHVWVIALLLFSLTGNSQTAKQLSKTQEVQLKADPSKKTILVSFIASQEIANMLVLVTDEKGNIIFLDNKYRFKGTYTHVISLKGEKGKTFEVQIKNDTDEIKKSLSML